MPGQESLFIPDNPGRDLGLTLLDQMVSGSGNWLSATQPLRTAIQNMLAIYSAAILVIAGFIVLYYIILTITDAARSGQAFRKINPVWGPVRLIIAIGLLVPLPVIGLNSGQMIVLKLAQWGSGLASQVWDVALEHNDTLGPMLATPKPVPTLPLVRALVLKEACTLLTTQMAYRQHEQAREAERHRRDEAANGAAPTTKPVAITLKPITLQAAIDNADSSQTTPSGWAERPFFCGAVTVFKPQVDSDQPLIKFIKQAHLDGLRSLQPQTEAFAANFASLLAGEDPGPTRNPAIMAERYQAVMQDSTGKLFLEAKDLQIEQLRRQMSQMGWIGAPAYLDALLRLNVRLIGMSASLPQVDLPELLMSPPPAPYDNNPPSIEYQLYQMLLKIDGSWGETAEISPLSGAGLSGLSTTLGHAVAVSREVTGPASVGHQLRAARDLLRVNDYNWTGFAGNNPLVGLAELGAYLTGKSTGLLAGAGILNNVGAVTGPMVSLITVLGTIAFFTSMALLLLVPLIPLLRFLLGIAVWLVQVFEALIAVPLVALAHLRAEEDGIAGQSAVLCYILVLQIILRPVLMVLGLMGGLIIFLLMLGTLNLVLSGTLPALTESGQVASLWFVLMGTVYALAVLAIANAAFKLIDFLPERTLTWLSGALTPATPKAPPATKA